MHKLVLLALSVLISGPVSGITMDDIPAEQRDFYQWYKSMPVFIEVKHPDYNGGEVTEIPKSSMTGSCYQVLKQAAQVESGQYANVGLSTYNAYVSGSWPNCKKENMRQYIDAAKAQRLDDSARSQAEMTELEEEADFLAEKIILLQGELKKIGASPKHMAGTGCDKLDPATAQGFSSAGGKRQALKSQKELVERCESSLPEILTSITHEDIASAEVEKITFDNRELLGKALDIRVSIDSLSLAEKSILEGTACDDVSLVEIFIEEQDLDKKKAIKERIQSAADSCPSLIASTRERAEDYAKDQALRRLADTVARDLKTAKASANTIQAGSSDNLYVDKVGEIEAGVCSNLKRYEASPSAGIIFVEEQGLRLCKDAVSGLQSEMNPKIARVQDRKADGARSQDSMQNMSRSTSSGSQSSKEKNVDDITSYAVLLGRAVGCGIQVDSQARRVGDWVDRTWSGGEKGAYTMLLTQGIKTNMEMQQSGRSPDSCATVRRVISQTRWP